MAVFSGRFSMSKVDTKINQAKQFYFWLIYILLNKLWKDKKKTQFKQLEKLIKFLIALPFSAVIIRHTCSYSIFVFKHQSC